ncbi:heavy metal translocating P-type ATPase [Denitratimonas sp. CY0512]|uniref:heavy metal translocating P-type ATPase n=1 Tax=Denitratimonas sp. CY0512 TaxID=3131940 RepID=UPI0030AB6C1A
MDARVVPVSATTCFHCGEALGGDAVSLRIDGEAHDFCCSGCAGAAEWIATAGLGDYYRLRQSQGQRVDAEQDEDLGLWDRPEVQAEHVRRVGENRQITVLTDGMRCAACAWLIDRALRRREGVADVVANAVTGRIRIDWNPEVTKLSEVLGDLAALGYRAHLAPGQAREDARRRARRASIMRLGVAGLGAMQAMMYAEAEYLDFAREMTIPTRDFLRWVTFLLSTPVVFYSGWPFISGMWNELRLRRFGMDTLVATSVLLAYFASLFETIRGGTHVWFDAAVMFVLFLLIAREIETAARGRATDHVDTLARARPAFALRETDAGRAIQVPVAMLEQGDIVRVAPGEALPADGIALEAGSFDESLLTGESVPVARSEGEELRAGSIAIGSTARLRVLRTGQETWISQLSRLIERAQEERPAMARLADVVASRFVLALFVAAALTCIWWLRHDPSRAFEVTLAVLVVACPCALSLAIPTALASAHGALARIGVLAVRPDALDALARVDTVVFDKTGTLTCGTPTLAAVEVFDGITQSHALALARALEHDSRHPLAQVFRGHGDDEDRAFGSEVPVQHIAGAGVEAQWQGRRWRLGHAMFAAGAADDGAIWLGDGERAWARFQVRDSLRPEAAATIQACRGLDLTCELLSGDGPEAVAEVAAALGIERHAARRTPEHKLARIRELQQQGHRVLMVGDGINDAPVLGGADVSVALHSGAALAHGAADFVLTAQSLTRVPQALALARKARATMRQNLAWALGYNALALPFAAAGWVAPWLAALGMAASSLIVTMNALRLVRRAPTRDTAVPPAVATVLR